MYVTYMSANARIRPRSVSEACGASGLCGLSGGAQVLLGSAGLSSASAARSVLEPFM